MRVMIISQPKAGTFLCANLLQEFGLEFTRMMIRQENFDLYDLTDKTREIHKLKLAQSAPLIKKNQFAVCHLQPQATCKKHLRKFKKSY